MMSHLRFSSDGIKHRSLKKSSPSSRCQSSSFDVMENGPFVFRASKVDAKRVSFVVASNME